LAPTPSAGRKRVGAELYAGTYLADLRRLLDDLDAVAFAHQRKCCGQAAYAAAGHQHRALVLLSCCHV
jgi:hypothetical protein